MRTVPAMVIEVLPVLVASYGIMWCDRVSGLASKAHGKLARDCQRQSSTNYKSITSLEQSKHAIKEDLTIGAVDIA